MIDNKTDKTEKKIILEARERLKFCIDDYNADRIKQKDDLLFSTLEQWPSHIRASREGDPNGPRPCLTIDQINQYIVQVVNDMRQNRPAVKARPVDDKADVETAEVFQGIIRQIEDQSVAQIPYMTAGESAVRIGEGYFRIITEYENDKSFSQAIKIRRVPDAFCVYLGPHVMPNGSDCEYGFVFEDLTEDEFKRKYPKAKTQGTDFDELNDDRAYWGEENIIRVCEYFYYDYQTEDLVFTATGQTLTEKEFDSIPEPKPAITDRRTTQTRQVKWCKLTAVEILEKRDWAGAYIPIVKVTGKEAWVNGKRTTWGLVRPAKDSLRMYNYVASTIVEKFALQPKAPFIGAKGQFEGVEDRWAQANTVNYAFLEYNPMSVDGLSVPPPQRQQPAPMEAALYQFLQTAREDVQSSLGMFKASLGKEQPNQSGKAILALTRESDTGTFHFADNLSLSIQHCGKILVDLIPKIYDTAHVRKILGEDGKPQTVGIDPNQPMAKREVRDVSGAIKKIYNLNVGTYDVTVTVGPSYNTKRMEAATLFTDLSNSAKDPVSAAVVRYLAIKNSDFSGAEQAAEMLEKLLPPGIVKKDGQPQIPPEVAQQMQMMQSKMMEMQQALQEAESGTKQAMAKVSADHDAKMKQIELDRQVETEAANLARQKAEAELKLKRDIAIEEANIKKIVADADHTLEKEKVACEMECKKQEMEMNHEIETKKLEQDADAKALPEISKTINDGLSKALTELGSILEESMKLNREVLETLKAPKNIVLTRNADGTPTGASVRTLN